MILVLIGLLALLYVSQEFVRKWFFKREGLLQYNSAPIQSPVDGTVCYIRTENDFEATKRWDVVQVFADPKPAGEWCQIGIYMSGYDRHFVGNPVPEGIISGSFTIGDPVKNVAMIDFWNFIKHYYFGMTPKLTDTSENHTRVYRCLSRTGVPVYCAVIADKFVGDLVDVCGEEDDVICYIRRGSQADLFIPKYMMKHISVNEGDHLRIGDTICSM